MKKLLLGAFLVCGFASFAQVGIGTPSPDASAMLDIRSNKKGVLMPNVALTDLTAAAPVVNPANSLLVYNTTTDVAKNLSPGYYYWSGAPDNKWKKFSSDADTVVSNASLVNTATVTVNGKTSAGAPIINTNDLTVTTGKLKSTVNGISSLEVDVLGNAINGLTRLSGDVKLGGTLSEATTITTDATNTLALSGLAASTTATDDQIVVTSGAGNVLKTIPYASVQGAISTKTASYTLLLKDESILVDTAAGDVTITLPAATGNAGKKYSVKKTSSDDNGVIVASAGGTIDSVASIYGSVWLQGWVFQSDGTNWYIVSRY
ncbi:hypothetical protein [Flavobacterium succinicans]|uniref:Uncharacterized protein n=1 Tax=Flavobacterium succinicans TaxID=29536 RepID=A0A199XS89_9FLAO|nr:hypothetical protein [Flavobacterium succinicans]OAZ04510.1 hypothetical protein FLB_10940 [Flavobacterium succinicans]